MVAPHGRRLGRDDDVGRTRGPRSARRRRRRSRRASRRAASRGRDTRRRGEPAFTPMRIGMPASPAASITASTRARSPMLPGLMRSFAAPRRGGLDREAVVEVDVGHDRKRRCRTIALEAVERVGVRDGARARSRSPHRRGARSARAWPRRRACRCWSSTARRPARRRPRHAPTDRLDARRTSRWPAWSITRRARPSDDVAHDVSVHQVADQREQQQRAHGAEPERDLPGTAGGP